LSSSRARLYLHESESWKLVCFCKMANPICSALFNIVTTNHHTSLASFLYLLISFAASIPFFSGMQ
jgi:hypothetical protein